jgi:anhydro-N-acetylmuramic acid kinase
VTGCAKAQQIQSPPFMPASFYIGLMSGTSLDGVDGVLAGFDEPAERLIRAHAHRPFREAEKQELLALNSPGPNELHRAALAANTLARCCAEVVADLLAQANVNASAVVAIASHGQTVRHRPGEFDGTGYTIQLNNPALLAELTGIDVVADFRSRDVAAGGQGAPLVPAFHRAVFGQDAAHCVAVINIGGISNISVLNADGSTLGFDCGPGNALMDHWCQKHTGAAFDRDGAWAAGGAIDATLLMALQAEPYFLRQPPKSTGRDLFNPAWLYQRLNATPRHAKVSPQDVQATLTELTAWACAEDMLRHAPEAIRVVVCGGGALNHSLMHRLATRLPALQLASSEAYGLPVDQVEAAAFAWLARAFVMRQPGNLASVTGARGARVLGALYPAR